VVGPAGEEHWISVNTQPLFHSGEDKPHAVAIAVNDVTDRRREEKFRDDVERIIRHDIKAPLISLFSMAQLAKMGRLEDFGEMIPRVEAGIQQVLRLVDSSDKLRRMESGGYTPRLDRMRVERVVAAVGETLASLARERGVRVEAFCSCGRPGAKEECLAETPLVESMLVNLVKNAVEASPRGGTVSVGHEVEEGMCTIRIRNAGAVPEAVRERFFEKDITFGKPGGGGLGTYSAMLIARSHGGDIELDTSEEGATTVTVRLPCGLSPPG
jgi:signal transduction histidine kinase